MSSPIPTPHINAPAGSFADTVLMPGDPLRAKFIADEYLENPMLVNNVRNVQGYTGYYHGKKVKSDLYDPTFAETCIKEITKVFGDSDVALAIYNYEAGLRDNPYERESASFSVKCGKCENLATFPTYAEALRVNRCPHCGKELYTKCKNCGKEINPIGGFYPPNCPFCKEPFDCRMALCIFRRNLGIIIK